MNGGFGAGGFGVVPWGGGAPTGGVLFVIAGAKQVAPRGVELSFSKALLADATKIDPASYTVALVGGGETWPVVDVHVYPGDDFAVFLEVDRMLTFGAALRVTVVADVKSADGDSLPPAGKTVDIDAYECLTETPPRNISGEPILSALADAVGRELTTLAGWHFTTLGRELATTDTTIVVRSTLYMPDAGRVRVGAPPHEHWYTYAGREPHRLTGAAPVHAGERLLPLPVTFEAPLFGTLPEGTLVLDWTRDRSLVERAWASALSTRAVGRMLDAIGWYPRPDGMADDDAYRAVLAALEWKEKSIWRALYSLLRAVFREFTQVFPGRMLIADRIEGIPLDSVNYRGCYVEMGPLWLPAEQVPDRTVYQIARVDIVADHAFMETIATPWTDAWAIRPIYEAADLIVLPYSIREIPVDEGVTRRLVVINAPGAAFAGGISGAATYLHEVADAGGGGWPENGYLLQDASEDAPPPGDPGQPLFIFDDSIDSAFGTWFSRLLRYVLPAGTRVETHVLDV